MRKYAPDFTEWHTFGRDQVVHDPHAGLGHDGQLEMQQVIVILVYRTGQGILDGDYRSGRPAVLKASEDVLEAFARQNRRLRSQ